MKTKTINLYEYSELSDKAKKHALDTWNEHNDNPFMQSHMINVLKEKLEERGIKYDTNIIDVRYSLSNCQGDGFMFEGVLQWGTWTVKIKHSGHYYNSNSKEIEMHLIDDENIYPEDFTRDKFEKIYQEICKEMERIGYDEIEYNESEESFIGACEANEYTFRENGEMEN